MLKNENNSFDPGVDQNFEEKCLEVFAYQYKNNLVYQQWVNLLKLNPDKVNSPDQIPFLPIEFFKKFEIVTQAINSDTVKFTSSGTSGQSFSTHYVNDISVYEHSFLAGFKLTYDEPSNYCILALLPNYLQRGGSSLVYMCHRLIEESKHPLSGFFLNNINELKNTIELLKKQKQKTILIGVSYALMDLCDSGANLTSDFTVMETGGMKGTRKELLKEELHLYLKKGFGIESIHSEYGMTELLSQAYSKEQGLFEAPPWMRFYTREVDDPLKIRTDHKTGGINVIDLANINSCAFIATKDLGRIRPDNKLELMGRYDHSDVRGCNLMMGDF